MDVNRGRSLAYSPSHPIPPPHCLTRPPLPGGLSRLPEVSDRLALHGSDLLPDAWGAGAGLHASTQFEVNLARTDRETDRGTEGQTDSECICCLRGGGLGVGVWGLGLGLGRSGWRLGLGAAAAAGAGAGVLEVAAHDNPEGRKHHCNETSQRGKGRGRQGEQSASAVLPQVLCFCTGLYFLTQILS